MFLTVLLVQCMHLVHVCVASTRNIPVVPIRSSRIELEPMNVTLTPWCNNSVRVQIVPSSLPPKVSATKQKLLEDLKKNGISEMPSALVDAHCAPGTPVTIQFGGGIQENHRTTVGNLAIVVTASISDGQKITFSRVDSNTTLFSAIASFTHGSQVLDDAYLGAQFVTTPGGSRERIYGLGQGNWTDTVGVPERGSYYECPSGKHRVVPLERNGQSVALQQKKFFIAIPFAYSSLGYGLLYNMPGAGMVTVGDTDVGGMTWQSEAALGLDVWVTTPASDTAGVPVAQPVYTQYADATGHAPMLREDAMVLWQSRNRYKSSAIALDIAQRYRDLNLTTGVLVIDHKNEKVDGDFAWDTSCYPSPRELANGVTEYLNASVVVSVWPEVKNTSAEYAFLKAHGCLANPVLAGYAVDPTIPQCRQHIWDSMLKPRFYDQGVSGYWLDETDSEGSAPAGEYGYNTSLGPAYFANNLWVNSWLSIFTDPVRALGEVEPLVLTRAVWAGGQRHGVVLWSSDTWSSFDALESQVPQGVHASLSGIPWWTTDVGGYGCGFVLPNNSPYMRELIVRWYQFGTFCPVFRTHGCREGTAEPNTPPCEPTQDSCGPNEVWSYGPEVQPILEKYIRVRAGLKPYIQALARNVSELGVPTMRPLWWEFANDADCIGINDQYLLGPSLLVAPVTARGATQRSVYFPKGALWRNYFDASVVVSGGSRHTVSAAIDNIPVYWRE
eukprot:m.715470 g.715470  ORF g.715470 m.715470 type:complete len:726 (+) comp22979_c0_seq5:177-2354(+)